MKAILEQIIISLNDYSKTITKSTSYKEVTETLKTLFAQQGITQGYCTAAHRNLLVHTDFYYDEGEWLFDLVWYKMKDDDDQIMTDIPLVLESELSDKTLGGLKVDFDKLLVAPASTKVFVTTHYFLEEKCNYIQKAIRFFNGFPVGEILYLIIWDESEGDFQLKTFTK